MIYILIGYSFNTMVRKLYNHTILTYLPYVWFKKILEKKKNENNFLLFDLILKKLNIINIYI